jgi:hypothetical protein
MGFHDVMHVAVLGFLLSTVKAAVSSTGFTVSLTDVPYFLPPTSVATILVTEDLKTVFSANSPFVPFTVIKSTGYSAAELSSVVAKYLAEDDVFQTGFLEGMLIFIHLYY